MKLSILIFFCLFSALVYAQTDTLSTKSEITYRLMHDTLFSDAGFKIFVGQSLKIGKDI